MKFSMLQQRKSLRGSGPLDSSSSSEINSSSTKSPAAICWLILHALCCLISLLFGFRFSRLVFLIIFSTSTSSLTTTTTTTPFFHFTSSSQQQHQQQQLSTALTTPLTTNKTRVVVGRHGIRIRPWPHPDATEVMKAHQIIERVQRQQRLEFGVKNPRTVIVVTPTYVRTFQALHLTGVMHSLMIVPYDVVWIVVEAGGVSNETASLIAKSGLRTLHIGFKDRMSNLWEDRHKLEARMRIRALRVVREEKLDGIVMFADDSNMHSMELFDEIQNVKWFGALSVGILAHSGGADESPLLTKQKKDDPKNPSVPVQGPACDPSNKLIGWHTFNSKPYEGKMAVYIDDRATVIPRKLEWAGFVLNSRLIWKDSEDKTDWVNDLDTLGEDVESPLALVRDQTMVEPLGKCGRQVLLWWLRVEARTDSKFPPGWIIDPPMDITVPSKHTPWPDTPPELPSNEKHELSTKHSTKNRRPKHPRGKKKHEPKATDTQVSAKQI
ncbi:hypothetical protein ACFE04_001941 [Oxalis oulophora]